MDERVARYLDHVRFEKRLAERTSTLYALDLQKPSDLAQTAQVDLAQVQTMHVRRWVAQMHSGGRTGRGIALILSGWRGFYHWMARESLIAHNPVEGVRAPKVSKPLPKALGVDEAAINTWCAHWITQGFDGYEALLRANTQRGRFSFGDVPGLADVYLVPQVESARRFKVDMARWPLISAVDAACMALEAFQKAAPAVQPDAS